MSDLQSKGTDGNKALKFCLRQPHIVKMMFRCFSAVELLKLKCISTQFSDAVDTYFSMMLCFDNRSIFWVSPLLCSINIHVVDKSVFFLI